MTANGLVVTREFDTEDNDYVRQDHRFHYGNTSPRAYQVGTVALTITDTPVQFNGFYSVDDAIAALIRSGTVCDIVRFSFNKTVLTQYDRTIRLPVSVSPRVILSFNQALVKATDTDDIAKPFVAGGPGYATVAIEATTATTVYANSVSLLNTDISDSDITGFEPEGSDTHITFNFVGGIIGSQVFPAVNGGMLMNVSFQTGGSGPSFAGELALSVAGYTGPLTFTGIEAHFVGNNNNNNNNIAMTNNITYLTIHAAGALVGNNLVSLSGSTTYIGTLTVNDWDASDPTLFNVSNPAQCFVQTRVLNNCTNYTAAKLASIPVNTMSKDGGVFIDDSVPA